MADIVVTSNSTLEIEDLREDVVFKETSQSNIVIKSLSTESVGQPILDLKKEILEMPPPPPHNFPKVSAKIEKENFSSEDEESIGEQKQNLNPKRSTRTKKLVDTQLVVEELPTRTTRTKKRKMEEEEEMAKKEPVMKLQNLNAPDKVREELIISNKYSKEEYIGNGKVKEISNSKGPVQNDEIIETIKPSPERPNRVTRSKVRKLANNDSPSSKVVMPKTPVQLKSKQFNKDNPKYKLNSPTLSDKLSGSPASRSPRTKYKMNQQMKGGEVQEISMESIQVSSSPGKVVRHKWNNNIKNLTTSKQAKTKSGYQTPSPLSNSSSKKILGLKSMYSSGNLQSSYSQKRAPVFSSSPRVGSKGLGSVEINRSKNILTGPSFITRVQPSKPTKEESEEVKLDELRKKREKEDDILKKKNELIRLKKEDQKRKNEERMRRVQESREARERKVAEAREMQEKEKKMREERIVEARQKKIMEAKRIEEAKILMRKQAEEEQKRKEERSKQEKRLREEERALEEERLKEEMKRIEERRIRLEEQRREAERIAHEKLELERIREAERIAREKKLEELRKLEQERESDKKLNSTYSTQDERNMNTTYTKPVSNKGEEIQSYEMTPVVPKKPSTDPNNYNIGDLNSDDSTDDESAPKKKIPSWAQGSQLKKHLFDQEHYPPDVYAIFPSRNLLQMPDLIKIFPKRRSRFTKRTSSAVWNTPPCKLLNNSVNK